MRRKSTRTTTCATATCAPDHYFNVTTYADYLRFVSTKIEGNDPKHFTITGDLTMHGQTSALRFERPSRGAGKSPRGRAIIA